MPFSSKLETLIILLTAASQPRNPMLEPTLVAAMKAALRSGAKLKLVVDSNAFNATRAPGTNCAEQHGLAVFHGDSS